MFFNRRFVDFISNLGEPDWPRKLIQTTDHKLGHALNLAHRFERPVGRADSTSFMNYDWKYLGGMNAARFWRQFDLSFDADEVAFLRHGPVANILRCKAINQSRDFIHYRDGKYRRCWANFGKAQIIFSSISNVT